MVLLPLELATELVITGNCLSEFLIGLGLRVFIGDRKIVEGWQISIFTLFRFRISVGGGFRFMIVDENRWLEFSREMLLL